MINILRQRETYLNWYGHASCIT